MTGIYQNVAYQFENSRDPLIVFPKWVFSNVYNIVDQITALPVRFLSTVAPFLKGIVPKGVNYAYNGIQTYAPKVQEGIVQFSREFETGSRIEQQYNEFENPYFTHEGIKQVKWEEILGMVGETANRVGTKAYSTGSSGVSSGFNLVEPYLQVFMDRTGEFVEAGLQSYTDASITRNQDKVSEPVIPILPTVNESDVPFRNVSTAADDLNGVVHVKERNIVPPTASPLSNPVLITTNITEAMEIENSPVVSNPNLSPNLAPQNVFHVVVQNVTELSEKINQTLQLGFQTGANFVRNQSKMDLNITNPNAPLFKITNPPTFQNNMTNAIPLKNKYSVGGSADSYISDYAKLNIDIVPYILTYHHLLDPWSVRQLDPSAFQRIDTMLYDPEKQYDFINQVLRKYDSSTQSPLPFVLLFVSGILIVFAFKKQKQK